MKSYLYRICIVFITFLAYVWAAPGDPHTNFYLKADQEALGLILEIRTLLTQVHKEVAVVSLQVHRASIKTSIKSYLATVPKKNNNWILKKFAKKIHKQILDPVNSLLEDTTLTVATLEKHCTEFLMLLMNVPYKNLEELRSVSDSATLAILENYSTDAVGGALNGLENLKKQLKQDATGSSGSDAGASSSGAGASAS